MAFPTNIINKLNSDQATFSVKVGGVALDPVFGIVGITVQKTANKITSATIVIRDGNAAKQKFEVSASPFFIPGNTVEIEMGYHNTNKPVFKGIIIKHSIQLQNGRPTVLVVEVKDKAVKLTVGRKNKCYYKKSDKTIIREILQENGLSLDQTSDATQVTHEEMVQYYATNWDFIVSRAEANGLVVLCEDGKIKLAEPNTTKKPKLNLTYGINVYEFQAEMDARDEYKEVKAVTWNDAKREVSKKTNKLAPTISEEGNITGQQLANVIGLNEYLLQHSGKITDPEMNAWAKSKFMRSRLAKIQGRVKIEGFSGINPGDVINISKFSPRFNKFAYVSGVTHQLTSESSWYTDIQFGMPQEWFTSKYKDVTDEPAAGLLPAINGLVIGIVKQIDKTDTELRVKVHIPFVNQGNDGVWARFAAPYAGENRGVLFRPEVDDEVVLGFLNDDPREPIILGSLHSSNAKGKTPEQIEKDNYIKGIFTKAKLKIKLDDKDKVITIETPNKNKITISDKDDFISLEDKNKNKIKMSKDGIDIESAKDINLKAKGKINASGSDIKQEAKQNIEVKATGKMDLTSSLNMKIKGQQVSIN